MIANIVQGASFAGAIRYALGSEGSYTIMIEGIKDGTNQEMAHSFETQARLNPITKPVAHISLNFSAEDRDKLTDEKMIEIAKEYMQKMGYDNTQCLMVRHTDREHPHLHLILNRVDFDGNRITDSNEHIRNIKATQELTHKHNLFIAEGKDNVKRHRLIGSEKIRYEIHDALSKHIRTTKSWEELQQKLKGEGISVEFKYNGSTDQIQGVKFTKDNLTFNGSKVDKQFSYSKIDYQIRQNSLAEKHVKSKAEEHVNIPSFSGGLGVFDLPQPQGDDPEEESFRRRMQKKNEVLNFKIFKKNGDTSNY